MTLGFDHEETDNGGSTWPSTHVIKGLHPETGEEVGFLKYRTPRRTKDKIQIDRLEVHPEHKGNGFGSAMMDHLQERHPKTPIDHGDRTDEGKSWWKSYTRGKSVTKGRTIATRAERPVVWQREAATSTTINYIHNPESSKQYGDSGEQYAQHVEPHGKYISEHNGTAPDGWESGTVTFHNPKHMDFGGSYREPSNWKHQLSAEYGGKTGAELSDAVRAHGHDGIITHDEYGTSEIVDLRHHHGSRLGFRTAAQQQGVSRIVHNDPDCPVCAATETGMVRTGAHTLPPYPNPESTEGEGKSPHAEGGPEGTHWYHGTASDPARSRLTNRNSEGIDRHPRHSGNGEYGDRADQHWNTDLGIHFSAIRGVAHDKFGAQGGVSKHSRIAHATLHMQNPAVYRSEHDLTRHAAEWAHENGHRYLPENLQAHKAFIHRNYEHVEDHDEDEGKARSYDYHHKVGMDSDTATAISDIDRHGPRGRDPEQHLEPWLGKHPDRERINDGFRQHLQIRGHDGIIYGNEYEGPRLHKSAIAFPSTPVHIAKMEHLDPDHPEHGKEGHDRTAGKGKPRHNAPDVARRADEASEDRSQGMAPDSGRDDHGGGAREALRPLAEHPKIDSDLAKLPNKIREVYHARVDDLRRGQPHSSTHSLNGPLKGWSATSLNFQYRMVHKHIGDELHVLSAGNHDETYDIGKRRIGSTRPLYHGTSLDFSEVRPSKEHGHEVFTGMSSPDHAYATHDPQNAKTYAEISEMMHGGRARVYEVHHLGQPHDLEHDPGYDVDTDVRSRAGFRVLREVPPHELKSMPRYAAQDGSRCPCGQLVEWDPSDGWQHADGSISHDGEYHDKSVSDLMKSASADAYLAPLDAAQNHMRSHGHPVWGQDLGDEESATSTFQHLLRRGGHPKAEQGVVFRHPFPERSVSSTSTNEQGEIMAALHPHRWDYGTLAHETAHVLDHHARGIPLNTRLTHDEKHDDGFMEHYRNVGNMLMKGAGDELHEAWQRERETQKTAAARFSGSENDQMPQRPAGFQRHDPVTWGDEYLQHAQRNPNQIAVQHTHDALGQVFPEGRKSIGADRREGSESVQKMLKHLGHPDADYAFAMKHPKPERGASNPVYDGDGIPGVALHPQHWTHEHMAHEVAHIMQNHETGREPGTPLTDEENHGPGFQHHFQRALALINPEASDYAKDSIAHYKSQIQGTHKTARYTAPKKRLFGPTYGLDTRLWDGEKLKQSVRRDVLATFAAFCRRHDYRAFREWARVVFFGSEASEWTSKDLRGNNDFDLSIGIEYTIFRSANPSFRDTTDEQIAAAMTQEMHAELNDPAKTFEGVEGVYDQTWFANLQGWAIERIRPYAAYNVLTEQWIVKPPHLPDWSAASFPQGPGLAEEVRGIIEMAQGILKMPEPHRTQSGAALWEFVHSNRSNAFGEQGEGWWDARNVVEKALDQKGLMQQLWACHERATKDPSSLLAPANWSNDPLGAK